MTAGGFSWIAAKMEYIRVQAQIIAASDTVAMAAVNVFTVYKTTYQCERVSDFHRRRQWFYCLKVDGEKLSGKFPGVWFYLSTHEQRTVIVCPVLANDSLNARNLRRHLTRYVALVNQALKFYERKLSEMRTQLNL